MFSHVLGPLLMSAVFTFIVTWRSLQVQNETSSRHVFSSDTHHEEDHHDGLLGIMIES